jgi:hypothetical protein
MDQQPVAKGHPAEAELFGAAISHLLKIGDGCIVGDGRSPP